MGAVPFGGRLRLVDLELEPGVASMAVELERFQAFTPDAVVEVRGESGTERLPVPDNAYYRGSLAGEPDSWVVLTRLESGELRGLLRRGDATWLLSAEGRAGSLRAHALPARAWDVPDERFECGADALAPPPARPEVDNAAGPRVAASHTARVAVETDHEFFLRFGSAVAAVDYVGDLFAYASTLYAREVDTTLLVSSVRLWTTPADPWNETSPTCGFYEFGRYWNDNQAGVSRTLAHFLSGKGTTAGIGWVGVLCRGAFNVDLGTACPNLSPRVGNWGGAYAYSGGISGSFNLANPGMLWDIVVVAHEIGHNFNSPHTHCYAGVGGSTSPVDACYAGQAGQTGCYSGATSLPGPGTLTGGVSGQRNGTIMSYCHLLGGGFGNIAASFGTGHTYGVQPGRVPTRMRSHVTSTAGSNPSCLAFTPPVKGDFNGDHQTDLVFRNTASNASFLWTMNGVTRLAELPVTPAPASADWRLAASDDFNGDQRTDLVYQNLASGAVEFWLLKSGAARWGAPVALSGGTPLPADWRVVASADFNADGRADLLWRQSSTQKLRIWTLNGAVKLGEITPVPDAAIDGNWEVVAALDANKDGATDLLWYNRNSGNIVFWYMNPAVVRLSGAFATPANAGDANWKVVAAGDYGPGPGGVAGTADIVWRNETSGRLVLWYMNASGVRTFGTFTTPDAPASPLAVAVVAPK